MSKSNFWGKFIYYFPPSLQENEKRQSIFCWGYSAPHFAWDNLLQGEKLVEPFAWSLLQETNKKRLTQVRSFSQRSMAVTCLKKMLQTNLSYHVHELFKQLPWRLTHGFEDFKYMGVTDPFLKHFLKKKNVQSWETTYKYIAYLKPGFIKNLTFKFKLFIRPHCNFKNSFRHFHCFFL